MMTEEQAMARIAAKLPEGRMVVPLGFHAVARQFWGRMVTCTLRVEGKLVEVRGRITASVGYDYLWINARRYTALPKPKTAAKKPRSARPHKTYAERPDEDHVFL